MPSKAQVDLIGHLGKDAEVSFLPNGTPVAKFSMAVNTGFKDKKVVSWYAITLWGKQAESLKQYLTKGKTVNVMGELSIRNYTTKDGKHGTSADVRVDKIFLLGGKDDGAGHSEPQQEAAEQRYDGEHEPAQQTFDGSQEVPF